MDLTPPVASCGCLTRANPGPGDWGLEPLRVDRPPTAAAAAAALEACAGAGTPVWVAGSATRLAACPPVPARAVVLSTAALSGVVAYEPADLTLTVRGGTPLGELHERLAADGLEIPGAHFGLAEGTVGGLVATDLADVRRGRLGAIRDRVLGVEVATADGRVTRSGGRVVKNVTGYDLHRLHAGAHGGLGVLTEITLRLAARPEAHAPFAREFRDPVAAARAAVRLALDAPSLGFAALAWQSGSAGPAGPVAPADPAGHAVELVWVHEGDREWVEEGAAWSRDAFGHAEPDGVDSPRDAVAARLALNALEHVCPRRSNLLFRGSVRPTRLPGVIAALVAAGVRMGGAYAVQGAVFARLDGSGPGVVAQLAAVAQAVESAGGTWRIQGAWRPEDGPGPDAAPWGGIETPWALYARLKDAFDPRGVVGPAIYGRARSAATGAA